MPILDNKIKKIYTVIFILGPSSGFLFTISHTDIIFTCLFFILIGIYIGYNTPDTTRIKSLVSIFSFTVLYGILLYSIWVNTSIAYVGIALVGFGTGMLFSMLFLQFPCDCKYISLLSAMYASMISGGAFFLWIFEKNLFLTLIFWVPALTLALIFLSPVKTPIASNYFCIYPLNGLTAPKTCVFFVLIGMTTFVSFKSEISEVAQSTRLFALIAGLYSGLLIFKIIVQRYGTLAGAVSIIFTAQMSLLMGVSQTHYISCDVPALILCGMLISMSLLSAPGFAHYLNCNSASSTAGGKFINSYILGFLIALFMFNGHNDTYIFSLLPCFSFFIFFSAWKHRLVLLKNKI